MEPWSSRYLTRRSRTTLGEMSDATRRKNSQEVSRLEVAVRHMDRELTVRAGELSHEQLVLQRSLTARPSPARRKSLTASAANFESLKQKEKDTMQALDDKCKSFIRGGDNREGDAEDRTPSPPGGKNHHYLPPTPGARSSASSEQEGSVGAGGRGSTSPQTEGGEGGGGRGAVRGGAAAPRERRYGVAHATDVQLDIDVNLDQQEVKNGYSPLRRTSLQQHKFRRTNSTSVTIYSNQQQGTPRRAAKRETTELATKSQIEAPQEGASSAATEDAQAQSRRKSLPFVLGRQMQRHDRSSKSRESLLLPNLGQGRSPSPMGDLRVKVTYADGEELSSMTDVPFRPHLVRSQRSLPDGGSSSSTLTGGPLSARGPRLEIDLSIPMGSPSARNSPTASPRPSGRVRSSKREKTYTV